MENFTGMPNNINDTDPTPPHLRSLPDGAAKLVLDSLNQVGVDSQAVFNKIIARKLSR